MAERSKAPDLRLVYRPNAQFKRVFWSPNGGVGSNPTPDRTFLLAVTLSFHAKKETWLQQTNTFTS